MLEVGDDCVDVGVFEDEAVLEESFRQDFTVLFEEVNGSASEEFDNEFWEAVLATESGVGEGNDQFVHRSHLRDREIEDAAKLGVVGDEEETVYGVVDMNHGETLKAVVDPTAPPYFSEGGEEREGAAEGTHEVAHASDDEPHVVEVLSVDFYSLVGFHFSYFCHKVVAIYSRIFVVDFKLIVDHSVGDSDKEVRVWDSIFNGEAEGAKAFETAFVDIEFVATFPLSDERFAIEIDDAVGGLNFLGQVDGWNMEVGLFDIDNVAAFQLEGVAQSAAES